MGNAMRTWVKLLAASAVLATSFLANATDPDTGPEPSAQEDKPGSFLIGAKVGGLIPFGGLSPNVRGGLEVGYVLPWLDRTLAVMLAADYAAPKSDGASVQDPRVPSDAYDWKLTEQELVIMPMAMYRFKLKGMEKLTPFAGIGPRIYMLRSTVSGTAGGASFGETTEHSTKVGFGVPFGAEYRLGPGGLLAELLVEYGGLDHRATGDSNTAATSLMVGYRFLL